MKEESADLKRPSTGRKQPRKAWGVEEVAVVAPLKMEEEEEKVELRRPATGHAHQPVLFGGPSGIRIKRITATKEG